MRKVWILLPLLLLVITSFAQQKIITGQVVRNSTKEPLQGVTVLSKTRSVMTDSAGRFSIAAAPGETLTLSFVGMNSLTIRVGASTNE
ncbi:MAG TPA: carboxypeptidase-like regulatory domain-containing protein, partial [Puia sp.]